MSEPTIAQRVNHIRKAWHEGRPAYGIITKAPGASLVRTLAGLSRFGLDFLVTDGEHGNYDEASQHDAFHAIASLGVSPIARVAGMGSEKWGIRVALDAGAHGVMVPLLESKEQAEDVVHRAKYPPQGGRTSGGSFNLQAFHLEPHGRTLTQEEYFKAANEATLIIAIIETKHGLENIDEIVQVKGLDAIFIGQYDLALSLGSLPQSSPIVQDGVKKIFASAKAAGVPVIAWSPGDEAKAAAAQGYEGLIVGLDMSILTRGGAEDLAKAGATKRW
ncbi:Pyruvate/Phosphoenolpyruvate kinase-like domain-containing protein [Naematelia encephala]|uniref:Pyruvate/Phosphoenolpyruvate kinase-like domain-containing protein n=1 Tax=Naematelia encephala TaxID=71784 RepID=A0A1Y2AK08_9TREE|nr:Pyruvate/Phosphoenolpyruvate kinase-like domain-containing protein [Naematelia encephala]